MADHYQSGTSGTTHGASNLDEVTGVSAVSELDILEERAEQMAEQGVGGGKPLGLWADTWRRLRRNKLALVGLGIIIVFMVAWRGSP